MAIAFLVGQMSAFNRHAALTIPALSMLLFVAGAGCGSSDAGIGSPFCTDPVDVPTVVCNSGGSASVAAPAGFPLPATVTSVQGTSCLALDGTCSNMGQFMFSSVRLPTGESVNFGIAVPAAQGPGTYALGGEASAPVDPTTFYVYGGLSRSNPSNDFADYYDSGLHARSGTLTLARNDASGLRATFDVELETEKGDYVIRVTRGQVESSGCAVRNVPTCQGD